jgi:uncharacterized protein YdeI (BOF family)
MKKFTTQFALTLALLGAFAMGSQLVAQDNAAPQPKAPSQEQPSPKAGAPDQPMASKAFTGKIVKEGGIVVLKDLANNITYQLDDQRKANQYLDKEVTVTGSLDPSNNTIHIENIEASS